MHLAVAILQVGGRNEQIDLLFQHLKLLLFSLKRLRTVDLLLKIIRALQAKQFVFGKQKLDVFIEVKVEPPV